MFSHSFSLSNFFKRLLFFINCSVPYSLFSAVWGRMEMLEADFTLISQIFLFLLIF